MNVELIINPEKKISLRIGDMNLKHQEQKIEHEDVRKNKNLEIYIKRKL